MQVEKLENTEEAEKFLLGYMESSILLLGNLKRYGPSMGDHPNSADFYAIKDSGRIHGVFALTKRGTFLIQTDMRRNYSALIFPTVDAYSASVKNFLGNWEDSYPYVNYHMLEYRDFHLDHMARQRLYCLELEKAGAAYDENAFKVRNLVKEDFDKWVMLREAYLAEMGYKEDLDAGARQKVFAKQCEEKNSWGGEHAGELVCMSGYHSTYKDQCQIGGVYTLPDYRGRQFGHRTMLGIIEDSRERGYKLMTLLTREDNAPACALYEGLGFHLRGHFGIFHGSVRLPGKE